MAEVAREHGGRRFISRGVPEPRSNSLRRSLSIPASLDNESFNHQHLERTRRYLSDTGL